MFLDLIHFDPNDHSCGDGQEAFIGLYTDTNKKTWRWSDDSPFDFAAWAPGQPDQYPNSFCGLIWNGPPCGAPAGTWDNWYCEEPYTHFVCKKQI